MIYYWLSASGEFTLRIDPSFLLFSFLAYRLTAGDARYLALSYWSCWFFLFFGRILLVVGIIFPQINMIASGFIALFEVSKSNWFFFLLMNGILFGWPILDIVRARKQVPAPKKSRKQDATV